MKKMHKRGAELGQVGGEAEQAGGLISEERGGN